MKRANPSSFCFRRVCLLIALCFGTIAQTGQNPESEAPEPAPLKGEAAEQARELDQRINHLYAQRDFAAAVQPAEQLLALRRRLQGAQWYESFDARTRVETLKQLASLSGDAQAKLVDADQSDDTIKQLYIEGKFDDAVEIAERQLEIRRRYLGARHPQTITSMSTLGVLLDFSGQSEEAEAIYRRALALWNEVVPAEHPMRSSTLNNLAWLLMGKARYDEAESLYEEALGMRRKLLGAKHPAVALSLNNLASLYHSKGDYAAAEPLYREALQLRRELFGSQHPEVALTLNNIALLLYEQGDYARAEPLFRESLVMKRKLLGDQHKEVATTLQNMASLYTATGKYDEAEEMYRESLEICQNVYKRQHPEIANILNNMGMLCLDRGDYASAEELFRKAGAVWRDLYGPRHPEVAKSTHNLASAMTHLNNRDEAESLFRQALSLQQELMGADHSQTAAYYQGLADLLAGSDDPQKLEEASELYQRALGIRRRASDPLTYVSCTNYADFLLYERNKPLEAIPLYLEAIEQIEQQRRRVAGDELDRSRYFSVLSRWDAFGGMISACVMVHEKHGKEAGLFKAFDYLERGRGRALLELLDRSGEDLYALAVEEVGHDGDRKLLDKLQEIRTREINARAEQAAVDAQWEAGGGSRADEEKRAKLVLRRQDAVQEERQAVRELFDLVRSQVADQQMKPMSGEDVSRSLRPGELLLAYDVGIRDAVLLVVRPAGAEPIQAYRLKWPGGQPVDRDSLDVAVRQWYAATFPDDSQAEVRATIRDEAQMSSALLPAPVAEQINEAACVFVVPDGALHRLPLEVLYAHGQSDRWVDSGPPLIYGPSATVLLAHRQSPAAHEGPSGSLLVAVGDPDFSSSVAVSGETRDAAAPARLSGSRHEVENLDAIFRKVAGSEQKIQVLTGENATVANVYRAAGHPRYLHLATHGQVRGGRRVYESALVLAAAPDSGQGHSSFLRLSDLLRDWGGRLQGTELVTLSACQSARGALEAGEGYVALTWGFMFAGADAVVASLWKVDDHATALLMTRFYENLTGAHEDTREVNQHVYAASQAMSKAVALLEAKRWLRQLTSAEAKAPPPALTSSRGAIYAGEQKTQPHIDPDRPYAHPFYWGAFVLIGRGEP